MYIRVHSICNCMYMSACIAVIRICTEMHIRGGQKGHPWAMLFIGCFKIYLIYLVLVEISADMFTTIIIAIYAIHSPCVVA